MFARSLQRVALLLALLFAGAAAANDTDLFASPNTVAASNVLVVFDNGASFEANTSVRCNISDTGVVKVDGTGEAKDFTKLDKSAGGVEQCALYAALSSLPANSVANFNIGFMMFNASGMKKLNPLTNAFTSCGGTDGGCLLVDLVGWTPTVKANLLDWVRKWESSGGGNYNIKASNQASGAVMQEAWAYFEGGTGVSGTPYTAPTIGCGKNFIVYVGNAFRNNTTAKDQTGDRGPKDPLLGFSSVPGKNARDPVASPAEKKPFTDTVVTRYGLNPTITCQAGQSTSYTFTGAEGDGTWGLNWGLYMYNQHDIKTTSIGFLGPDCLPSYAAFLQRLGEVGGGGFYATNDYETLKVAFQSAISNIISVNSVFASVALPVSVNTQGSYLNQVFVGMFRPDDAFKPRWYGNLKQYRLGFTGADTLRLMDANGVPAINTNTGFIQECARSFWTPDTTTGEQYWERSPRGSCITVAGSDASDYPDGSVVEKGAQAYMLRKLLPATRSVKTCAATVAGCTGWFDFTTGTSTTPSAALFGPGIDDAERDVLVNWARGQNNKDNELGMAAAVMRASAHGDVMHSRPVAINHGTDAAPQVVVYYGANDGMLHAINGNQTGSITSAPNATPSFSYPPGAELWSFMPPEFYQKIPRLYENTVPILYRGSAASALAKPYGMDGPVVAFKGTISGASKTYVYAAMRRGGRALYAFDVSNPGDPQFLWKRGCDTADLADPNCGTGAANYTNLGQTWAPPRAFFSDAHENGARPLLLMGGGYDTCEDSDVAGANHSCSTPKGSRVYVIDAVSGNIIREFATATPYSGGGARGVIGEPTIVNVGGKAKYAYIADLGGVVYRLDFSGATSAQWSMKAIAKVGCDTTALCSANRKFMFQPSVVSADGEVFHILAGSGDREKPTTQYGASNGVKNYFFMVKDKPSDVNWWKDACGTGNDFACLSSLEKITTTNPDQGVLDAKKGWYLELALTEQVVTSAVTLFGVTTFSTHQPAVAAGVCTNNLGTSRVYNISYLNAAPVAADARFEDLSGDGLPPSPVAGRVLIDGVEVPFCIGCSKESPLESKKAAQLGTVSRAKSRLYWYLEKN